MEVSFPVPWASGTPGKANPEANEMEAEMQNGLASLYFS